MSHPLCFFSLEQLLHDHATFVTTQLSAPHKCARRNPTGICVQRRRQFNDWGCEFRASWVATWPHYCCGDDLLVGLVSCFTVLGPDFTFSSVRDHFMKFRVFFTVFIWDFKFFHDLFHVFLCMYSNQDFVSGLISVCCIWELGSKVIDPMFSYNYLTLNFHDWGFPTHLLFVGP